MRWKLAVLAALAPLFIHAEDDAVFLGNDLWKMYTTPQIQFTEMGDDEAAIGALSIGTVLNDQWRFGIQLGALIADVDADGEDGVVTLDRWSTWELGADFGYILNPADLVHLDIGLFLGGARLEGEDLGGEDNSEDVFLAVPSVSVCLNLHETWEIGLGAAWRQYNGVGIGGLDDDDVSGPAFTIFARATEF